VIGQILGVRWAGLLVCVVAATAAAAPRASNPAFLGIEMRNPGSPDPCMVGAAIADSPADLAGLHTGDVVVAFDGAPIANCTALLGAITAHAPGDLVPIKLQRFGAPVVVKVQLSTRDALLGKVLGKPVRETHLVAVDGGTTYDLSALHGQPAIVGLYNPACVECAPLLGKFLAWARERAKKGGPVPLVLAVSSAESVDELRAMQRSLDVPLVSSESGGRDGDGSLFSRELVISDADRLGVVVIDVRGTVQYVGPIAPDSDDADAVLEEVFAAADQASRRGR